MSDTATATKGGDANDGSALSVSSIAPTGIYDWTGASFIVNLCLWLVPFKMSDDLDSLQPYGIKKKDTRYLYYLGCIFVGVITPAVYLSRRRSKLLQTSYFDRDSIEQAKQEMGIDSPLYPYIAGGFCLVGLVLSAMGGSIGELGAILFLLSFFASPIAVFLDARDLVNKGVVWGGMRYVHALACFFPFFLLIYLFQRAEHVFYTALVKSVDGDLE